MEIQIIKATKPLVTEVPDIAEAGAVVPRVTPTKELVNARTDTINTLEEKLRAANAEIERLKGVERERAAHLSRANGTLSKAVETAMAAFTHEVAMIGAGNIRPAPRRVEVSEVPNDLLREVIACMRNAEYRSTTTLYQARQYADQLQDSIRY